MQLVFTNSKSRKKEAFTPITPGYVGLYLCGPTVYGPPHLGHARPAVTADVLTRLLKYAGYKVRFVRNITDVGHLEADADEGEDKIAKKARLEQLEPMEIVQLYTVNYNDAMTALGCAPPSIEPRASGHIIEQITMIEEILRKGYAYVSKGSVYFDVLKYNETYPYGELSGRILDDLMAGAGNETRELEGQDEKKNPPDFALWKKAQPEHIMRWPSPWSDGFPGWHIECSAMGTKYLGTNFDIHLGGMDLLFPHHEAEIAQNKACYGQDSVRYWIHNNMITIDGQKMGKSLGNFINLEQFFNGDHPRLTQAFAPMTIRYFMLTAHYRSTLDFGNDALIASEKALQKIWEGWQILSTMTPGKGGEIAVGEIRKKSLDALADDMNTAICLSHIFELVKGILAVEAGQITLSQEEIAEARKFYEDIIFGILGLIPGTSNKGNDETLNILMDLILTVRADARLKKDWSTSDKIRDALAEAKITLKDGSGGTSWTKKN